MKKQSFDEAVPGIPSVRLNNASCRVMMNDIPGVQPESGRYELRIVGHLDNCWAGRFEGLALNHESDGTATSSGPVIDQAALHGLLAAVRDLGVTLISVRAVPDPEP
jgi:hypothetical protein